VIVLFATSDAAGVTNFWLLAWGILSIFLGWPLMRNNPSPSNPSPSNPSQRFRLLRRLFGKKDKGPPPDQG
jgi:hypothetical protein